MTTEAPAPPWQAKRHSEVPSIGSRADLRLSQDPALARHRKDLDRRTVRRIVDVEADELIPEAVTVARTIEQLKKLTAMAGWSGSEREDALRLTLRRLEEAARR